MHIIHTKLSSGRFSSEDPLVKRVFDELLRKKQSELLSKGTGLDHLLTINSIEGLAASL